MVGKKFYLPLLLIPRFVILDLKSVFVCITLYLFVTIYFPSQTPNVAFPLKNPNFLQPYKSRRSSYEWCSYRTLYVAHTV